MANEVGTIGQMYEDRKSGKLGVLESREEKYKTLMLRGEDGKTFSIQYSTFRSNWRKYQGDKLIQTSSQTEAEAQKQETEAVQAKENLAEPKKRADKNSDDRRKSPMSREDLAQLQKDGSLVIKTAFDKAGIELFTLTQKFMAKSSQTRSTIKCGKQEIAEIWIMKDKDNIGNAKFFMPEMPFSKAVFSKAVGDIDAKKSTNPKEKRPISFKISTDKLDVAISDLLKSLEPVFKDIKEKAEKEEKENKKIQ